ncbi:MAG: L-threonylcarbamoyladenylate synthase [Vicinamibacterales bacterium]
MAEVFVVDPLRPQAAPLVLAARCLARGGLVAFPTETVYGLGVNALDRAAVGRLFAAKGRPANDPLIVHAADLARLSAVVGGLPPLAHRLAARFWPGPLTLVLPRHPDLPDEVTAGLDTVAVRVPAHPVARALLERCPVPVAAPSANLFSRPSPTTAAHVLDDLADRIDMVLDAGATDVGVESTVLDLTTDPPRILRPGAVSLEQLREVVPGVARREPVPAGAASADTAWAVNVAPGTAAASAMPSPGMLSRHYAPRTPLTLVTGAPAEGGARLRALVEASLASGHRVGVLAYDPDLAWCRACGVQVAGIGPDTDPAFVARRLYGALRELDAAGLDVLFVRDLAASDGLGPAVRDRLRRAAVRIVPAP